MATAIRSGVIKESPSEPCAWPTFESLEESVRGARRAVVGARHAAEDVAADAVLKIRRHPLKAIGIAMAAGVVVGSVVGAGFGWFARLRTQPSR